MESYVEVNGVLTWYERAGAGDPLLLLHPGGAGVDSRAWSPNIEAFRTRFTTFTPDRRAHGRTPDVAGPITFEVMADDTVGFVEAVIGEPAHLALQRRCDRCSPPRAAPARLGPQARIHRSPLPPRGLGARRDRSGARTARVPGGELRRDLPGRPRPLSSRRRESARMHQEGPTLKTSYLGGIQARTLVMVADDDEVTLEHAISMYRAIPDSELAVVPGTSHGLLVEKPQLCNLMILDFLTSDAVPTVAPIRRLSRD